MVKLKNQAENLIYNYDSTLNEQGNLIRDELKAKIARIKEEFKIACNNPHSTLGEINDILEKLRQTLLEIGTDVYQQKNSEAGDSFMFDVDDFADTRTEMNMAKDNSVKAVVSISNDANIEGVDDLGLDDTSLDDYESVD